MSFQYDDVGKFGSRAAAEEWAKRNNVDPRDLHIRDNDGEFEASLRRGSVKNDRFDDSGTNRRDGF